jgi:hypothetical protein
VTIVGNSARSSGGAISNYATSPPVLNSGTPILGNTIVWGNTAPADPQINNDVSSSTLATYSDIQGGYPGTGNINADPRVGALGNYGGGTQTIPLLVGSAAIDTANDSLCPATDQRGIMRPQGAHCDMGAYEFVAAGGPTPTSTSILPTSTPTMTPPPSATPTQTLLPPTATPTVTTGLQGSICVQVWNDPNSNGVRDGVPLESLVSGVKVSLLTLNGVFLDSLQTNSNRPRCFANLTPGQYQVVETTPSGYTSTTPDTVTATVGANAVTYVEFGDLRVGKKN